ncbi:DNA-3-methyladenine glycosylase [Hathewaya histolytica]|uniref:DNA-3-methyladenine glycosylase n=1 Tax=Hathewaya histolytica TaxID=1498 RepID=UPI003B67FC31
MDKLNLDFYRRDSIEVSRDLLGKYLVHSTEEGDIIGKIVEVEAYKGTLDKAAHSYGGKPTKRTEVMFEAGGISYVYLIYGMYNCLNVVASTKGIPEAVLIRSVEPIENIELMCRNRYNKSLKECKRREVINLTSGPGKLCKALGIDRSHNGLDLTSNKLYILEGKQEDFEIIETTRIGIDYAEEAKDFPWRFYIKDNPYISKK